MKTDLSYLREMSGGNKELVLEMISIFSDQVVEFAREMEQHLENGEYDLLGKLSHKAKSSVSIMGLHDLSKELKNLETLASEGKKTESYADIISRFRQETEEASQELKVISDNIELYF